MNLDKMIKERKDLINDLKPYEMELYLKNLINNLYKSFLEQDTERALASKELIEEATKLYEAKGYINSFSKELEFRLAKANEVLIETLEAKDRLEANLSGIVKDSIYSSNIDLLSYSISILKILIVSYEKERSQHMLETVKAVADRTDLELTFIKFLLAEDFIVKNEDHVEEIEILKEKYSTYENLVKKINSF